MTIKNKKILITGGSGSLGFALAQFLHEFNHVVIFSRNEERQFSMQQKIPSQNISYVIGDIRDRYTLIQALQGCDIAIHAAAMKDMIMCEKQPTQTYLNNLEGTRNFIDCCSVVGTSQVLGISTDKASEPSNTYGASKYIMEQLFIEANHFFKSNFYCVRFGNVIDSNGSLITYWKENPTLPIKITHPEVSRFFFKLRDAVDVVTKCLMVGKGGKIYIPKMKKVKIIEILRLITKKSDFPVLGLFPGEKLHESLVSSFETRYCHDIGDFYVIDRTQLNSTPPEPLNSGNAPEMSINELQDMLFEKTRV